MSPRRIVSLFACFVLGGCGVVTVRTTSSGGPSHTGSGGGGNAPSPGAPEKTSSKPGKFDYSKNAPEDDERVLEVFRKFDHTQAGAVVAEGAGWYFSNHIKTKPLYHPYRLANPDPDWIPGWSEVQADKLDDSAYEALAQASVNKSWAKQCDADYEDYRTRWKALEAKVTELASGKTMKNPYQKIGALRAARKKIIEEGNAAKLFLQGGHPDRWSGPFFDSVKSLMETLHESNRDFRVFDLGVLREEVDAMAKMGHVFGNDAAFEKDLFCAYGMKFGTHRTPALPTFGGRKSVNNAVKWPVSPARRKEIDAKLAEGRSAITQTMTAQSYSIPNLALGSGADKKEPKLYLANAFKVVSVAGNSLELTKKVTGSFSYNCKTTNKIARIESDGRVIYFENCLTGTSESEYFVHATIADLPEGGIAKGDTVNVFVDVASKTDKHVKDQPNFSAWRYDYTATVRHVSEITRGDTKVGSW